MRMASRICGVVSWIVLVVFLFLNALLILTLWMPPFFADMFPGEATHNEANATALPLVLAGTVLFLAGFFLFRFLRQWRWVWFVAMAVGAFMLAGVGLYLQVIYPSTIINEGFEAGYTSMSKLVTRHMLPLGVLVLEAARRLLGHIGEDKALFEEAVQEIKEKGVEPKFDQ